MASVLDRRGFLISGAAAAATGVKPSEAQARVLHGDQPWTPRAADIPEPIRSDHFLFFTSAEAQFIEAATERLIPADELGPGAKECDVTLFIDHQLAGEFGRAESWYMRGPWAKGEPTQGFQSRMAPAPMYRAAIKAIEANVASTQGGKKFADLSASDQDRILTELEGGKVDLAGVDAKSFFGILLMNTKEGMFSDPIYGGNKNMAAWKMIGFPGARYDYRDWVSKHGQRCDLSPVSLSGQPGWTVKS